MENLTYTFNIFLSLSLRQVKCFVEIWLHHVLHHTVLIQLGTEESVVPHAMVSVKNMRLVPSQISTFTETTDQLFVFFLPDCQYDQRVYANGVMLRLPGSGPCLHCRCKAGVYKMFCI